MPPSFTSPAETSADLIRNRQHPFKSKSYYIQYLLSGQVPPAGYGSQLAIC